MNSKGQGSIEYLLIIGAAVIIAVIVIVLMMALSQQGTTAVEEAGLGSEYTKGLISGKQCEKLLLGYDNGNNTGSSDYLNTYSYYVSITPDKLSTFEWGINNSDFDLPNDVYVGQGLLITNGMSGEEMIDRIYWALENKYISILINGKDALTLNYSLEKSHTPNLNDSSGNTVGVIYWENKAWISVDKGPFG
jgi:hypothetical protein